MNHLILRLLCLPADAVFQIMIEISSETVNVAGENEETKIN